MFKRHGSGGPITARLDALRFELKTDIANLRTEVKADIAGVRTEVSALAQEFKEFRGVAKGMAVVFSVLVPILSAVAVSAANLLLKPHV